jgi:hypothetical protein
MKVSFLVVNGLSEPGKFPDIDSLIDPSDLEVKIPNLTNEAVTSTTE